MRVQGREGGVDRIEGEWHRDNENESIRDPIWVWCCGKQAGSVVRCSGVLRGKVIL